MKKPRRGKSSHANKMGDKYWNSIYKERRENNNNNQKKREKLNYCYTNKSLSNAPHNKMQLLWWLKKFSSKIICMFLPLFSFCLVSLWLWLFPLLISVLLPTYRFHWFSGVLKFNQLIFFCHSHSSFLRAYVRLFTMPCGIMCSNANCVVCI